MASKRAFTVTELVIVIVIVSILAVVLIPRMAGIRPFKLDGAVQRLIADMKYAQKLAMSRNEVHGVSFKPSEEKYIVFAVDESTPLNDPLHPGSSFVVSFRENDHFREIDIYSADFAGESEVMFNSLGTPIDGSGTELGAAGEVVLRYRSEEIIIQVIPHTGRIKRAE